MKKLIVILIFTLLNINCNDEYSNITGPLQGTWIRKGTIIYKKGKPFDTIPYKGIHFKIYDKNSFLILINPIKLDSITGEDVDKGFALGGENYFISNGYITEKVKYGTGWTDDMIKNNLTNNKDYMEFKLKLEYGPNHFSQAYPLDSLGDSSAYYFERVKKSPSTSKTIKIKTH